ncbi:MAG: branched-chain amino acid ABC transporter permease [Acidimicrobiia bacterium]
MSQFAQQLVNGTVLGATYGLIAVGYTMVYGIISLINFAHGEVFMVGAFGGLAAWRYVLPDSLTTNAAVTLPVVILAGVVVAALTALALERLAYRPLRGAPRLAPLITAIGMSLAMRELVRLYYPDGTSDLPFPRIISNDILTVGGVSVAYVSLFAVGVALALMAALDRFVNATRVGKAMRATSQDPDTARLMGIDTDRIIVVTFAIGGALAGVAGVIEGMRLAVVKFDMGFLAGLKAFTAAVLGGIGSIRGAMLGGFLIGLIEAMATQYLPGGGAWKDVWVFAVLIVVLTLRPSGLLGTRETVRA